MQEDQYCIIGPLKIKYYYTQVYGEQILALVIRTEQKKLEKTIITYNNNIKTKTIIILVFYERFTSTVDHR